MKDARGHGSNRRGGMPIPGHPYHSKSDAELRYIMRDASEAAHNMRDVNAQAEGKYLDQANDAATVLGYRARTRQGPSNTDAASELHSGPKSDKVRTHDSMGGNNADEAAYGEPRMATPKSAPQR